MGREVTGLEEDRHNSGRSKNSRHCRHNQRRSCIPCWVPDHVSCEGLQDTTLDMVGGASVSLGTEQTKKTSQQWGDGIERHWLGMSMYLPRRVTLIPDSPLGAAGEACHPGWQQMHRDSSQWHIRSSSSSGSRSPSANGSGRRRHQSPPLRKPQIFEGKNGEWDSFIFQFRRTARYYGWSQREKAERLLASLWGKAVDFIMKNPREVQDEYGALRDALAWHFGKREHPTSARRQLSYLRQEERESLEDFADRVLTKVIEAYPGADEELEQDLAKESFLCGCQNRRAAYAAAEEEPETLQGAVAEVQNSAVNLEAFGELVRQPVRSVSVDWMMTVMKAAVSHPVMRGWEKCLSNSWKNMNRVRLTVVCQGPPAHSSVISVEDMDTWPKNAARRCDASVVGKLDMCTYSVKWGRGR